MKIFQRNTTIVAGPSFGSNVNIPTSNLPVYVTSYNVRVENEQGRTFVSTFALKPSSSKTRVIVLQTCFEMNTNASSSTYHLRYVIDDTPGSTWNTFQHEIVYSDMLSGNFTIQEDENDYSVVDYWTYELVGNNTIVLSFTPSSTMTVTGKVVYINVVL